MKGQEGPGRRCWEIWEESLQLCLALTYYQLIFIKMINCLLCAMCCNSHFVRTILFSIGPFFDRKLRLHQVNLTKVTKHISISQDSDQTSRSKPILSLLLDHTARMPGRINITSHGEVPSSWESPKVSKIFVLGLY